MKKNNPYQLSIMQKLLYSNGLTYSKIKPKDMEGSKFTFHLTRLIDGGFVEKISDRYILTAKGKEYANRMDLGDKTVESQAKISVIMVNVRNINSNHQYLLYTRKKSPFFGYQGFPTGKVKKGEYILTAAKRELYEETGLKGNPKLIGVRHYKIFDKEKNLIEDKIFFVCRFDNPIGNIISGPEGNYMWIEKDNVWDYLKKPVREIKEIIKMIEEGGPTFSEKSYTTSGF